MAVLYCCCQPKTWKTLRAAEGLPFEPHKRQPRDQKPTTNNHHHVQPATSIGCPSMGSPCIMMMQGNPWQHPLQSTQAKFSTDNCCCCQDNYNGYRPKPWTHGTANTAPGTRWSFLHASFIHVLSYLIGSNARLPGWQCQCGAAPTRVLFRKQ